MADGLEEAALQQSNHHRATLIAVQYAVSVSRNSMAIARHSVVAVGQDALWCRPVGAAARQVETQSLRQARACYEQAWELGWQPVQTLSGCAKSPETLVLSLAVVAAGRPAAHSVQGRCLEAGDHLSAVRYAAV